MLTLLLLLLQAIKPDFAADIETQNPTYTPAGEFLFEGDMILSPVQVNLLYRKQGSEKEVRKGTSVKGMIWPDGRIPYRYHSTSLRDREVIEKALNAWRNLTCLEFEEITLEQTEQPHLIFTKKSGCWSDVGRKFWNNGQELSIGYGCEGVGTIMHEVGHIIGLYHEHTRQDRDNHVTIVTDNIPKDKRVNFKKQTLIDSRNVPYDYDSIMHYSTLAFSSNGQKTILPKDPTKEFVLGQRDHLSFYDLKLVHLMYQCEDKGKCGSAKTCQNDGFVNHRCSCMCPTGFRGAECEVQEPQPVECGGYVTTETNVTSPNYPDFYPADKKCIWWVKAPPGKKVKVTFPAFELKIREDDTKDCYWDRLEVRIHDQHTGETFCGTELQGKSYTTDQEDLVLVFVSRLSRYARGFLAQIRFV